MKILFITSTRIGDAVLSTGLLDHLLTEHPEARVTAGIDASKRLQIHSHVEGQTVVGTTAPHS